MARTIVQQHAPQHQVSKRTSARPRSPHYDRRDEIARAQGFASYWQKRKALAAKPDAELDGRKPRWRARRTDAA